MFACLYISATSTEPTYQINRLNDQDHAETYVAKTAKEFGEIHHWTLFEIIRIKRRKSFIYVTKEVCSWTRPIGSNTKPNLVQVAKQPKEELLVVK
jgi:hypothetical protein